MKKDSARLWLVSGTVQGVGFRFFVQGKALALGLTGWAKNLEDGTVQVYACGPLNKLDDLAAALHTGPKNAVVRSVEQQEASAEALSGFRVL